MSTQKTSQLLQEVLLVAGRLQHLLQRGELTHGFSSDLPPLHRVAPPLPLHCGRERPELPSGRHAAVRRAVAVVAIVPRPYSRFTAVNFRHIVPNLERGAGLWLRVTGAAL
ncbi:hypothetical protein F7725_012351 [Dissostichus mawsoni]|uniref:Uncharacterized protein n=1 Tax=Dissostichus mawsoni TaxID=36200 RepID=A0A7J5YP98_DISMA|nr:hypothetical protein F7725_012351 [Dissostichus mawsoni]